MNYETITTCDVCNGEGVGVVLWVSGCDVQCPGCHNKETWDPNTGKHFDEGALQTLLNELNRSEITRLTLSGGHPLMPCNREEIKNIINKVRKDVPKFIEIWLYTGYEYEKMDEESKEICNLCDVIVDGPYIKKLKDTSLPFRGSTNQRIIKNH